MSWDPDIDAQDTCDCCGDLLTEGEIARGVAVCDFCWAADNDDDDDDDDDGDRHDGWDGAESCHPWWRE